MSGLRIGYPEDGTLRIGYSSGLGLALDTHGARGGRSRG